MKTLNPPTQLIQLKNELGRHPLFARLQSVESLRLFMQTHVYAVWDFMSLLKSLQREISCVQVPWRPSRYSKQAVRLINEIVLGEESDVDENSQPCDHFSMYLQAMDEVGANTALVREFLATLDMQLLPVEVREFVGFNLEVATKAPPHQVAGAFFFGREDLIPSMFSGIVDVLKQQSLACPKLLHYLERHIELDGQEHGPLALNMLWELSLHDEARLQEAYAIGIESLKLRQKLWDNVLAQLP